MKIRIDFVSNSSSSSFICSPEDAKDIELFNNSTILDLHQYIKRFGECEVFYNIWWDKNKKIKFVSDDEFCRRFKHCVKGILPRSAKKTYLMHPDDFEEIASIIEKVLAPTWGNAKFEYYEAENCMSYTFSAKSNEENDYYDYSDNEESYLEDLFSKRDMKFSRIFNNH